MAHAPIPPSRINVAVTLLWSSAASEMPRTLTTTCELCLVVTSSRCQETDCITLFSFAISRHGRYFEGSRLSIQVRLLLSFNYWHFLTLPFIYSGQKILHLPFGAMSDVSVEVTAAVTVVVIVPNVARLHLVVAVGTASVPVALAGAVTGTTVAMIEMAEATNAGGEAGPRRGRAGGALPLIEEGMIGLGLRRWKMLKARTTGMTGRRRRRRTIIDLPSKIIVHFSNPAIRDEKCFIFSCSSLKCDVTATLQNENLIRVICHFRISERSGDLRKFQFQLGVTGI